MKIKLLKRLGVVFGAILLLAGCEYTGPEAIWNPDADLGPSPTITAVNPPDSAAIGVGEIRITGENFGTTVEQHTVYFNGQKGVIKQFSPPEIVVYRPAISGNDVAIKVQVDGAYLFGEQLHYKIPLVYRAYGNIIEKGAIALLDVARNDNIYAMYRKDIYIVTADETNMKIGTQGYKGTTSDIKMGPGGYLYMKKKDHQMVYRFDVTAPNDTLTPEEYGSLARMASYIDFDQYGNLYGGGKKTGISVLKNGISYTVGNFQDLEIMGLRVFDGYVYVSDGESNLWRAMIQDQDGHLADKQQVLVWANTGEYAASVLSSFDFAADGTICCGTDYVNPIFMFHPNDGTIEPLYVSILIPVAKQVVWSNHKDIYVNQTGRIGTPDLYLLRVGKEGAPHYGRTL